jgi:hypothetical protein
MRRENPRKEFSDVTEFLEFMFPPLRPMSQYLQMPQPTLVPRLLKVLVHGMRNGERHVVASSRNGTLTAGLKTMGMRSGVWRSSSRTRFSRSWRRLLPYKPKKKSGTRLRGGGSGRGMLRKSSMG